MQGCQPRCVIADCRLSIANFNQLTMHARSIKSAIGNWQSSISVVRSSPRTRGLYSIDCEIGVSVVTRFIELGQVRAFGFAQFSFLDPAVDEAPETVVQ